MPQEITLEVNGRIHRVCVEPDTPLLYVLRNDLGLKGAKFACGLGQCGACKIIIDGQAVPSCRIPVRSVQGREITTLEDLGTADDLHPLQKAFIEEQAVQCGFCASGMIIAADVGQIVNPDGLSNQLEGAFIQSASWTLKEQLAFDPHGIISVDWYSYPILRFRDTLEIETVLLNRPGLPYLGIGEGAQGPIPAAITNAVFDAVGIRLRQIPFTPQRVKAALRCAPAPGHSS
jgi:nicotinate dehydrogenase subunit A